MIPDMTTTPANPGLTQISIKVETEKLEKVGQLAQAHQRTLSGEIRMALDAWIAGTYTASE